MRQAIAALLFVLVGNPLVGQELPAGYEQWVVALNQKCEDLEIEMRFEVTLDGKSEALAMWWQKRLINLAVETTDQYDREKKSISGIYDGEWVTVESVDEQTEAKADRLVEASIIQAGEDEALQAFHTCQSQFQQRIMNEIKKGFAEMSEE